MARLIQMQQEMSREWKVVEDQYDVEFSLVQEELKRTKSKLAEMIQKSEASEQEKRDLLGQLQSYSQRVSDEDLTIRALGIVRNMAMHNIEIDPVAGSSSFLLAAVEMARRRHEEHGNVDTEEKSESEG